MKSIPWLAWAALAALFAGAAGVVAIVTVRSVAMAPIHKDAASVPSTPDGTPAARYADAVAHARQLARTIVTKDNLPGLSLAVAVNGDIAWAEAFGYADVDDHRPITPGTRFRLGALSKPLTSVAVARLRDDGRLDLDAPVQRYVPAYPVKAWPVTTRQLLGDVAGVQRIRGDNNDAMPTQHCDSVDEAVGLLTAEPLRFQPGTEHRYSIWGWTLVSAVVQGAAGEPFGRAMEREVFEPLGMTRTVPAETDNLTDGAHGRDRGPDYSCLAGGGAFQSTPSDLVRLGSAMLKPGFLRAETIAEFQRPTRLTSGATATYALGWTVASAQLGGRSVRVVSHRGSPAGGTVTLLTFPELGVAVAVAANVGDARGAGPLALEVAEAFRAPASRPIDTLVQ